MRHRVALSLAAAPALFLAACDSPQPTAVATSDAPRLDRAPAASAQTVIASGLLYPRGLAFDASGNIYVAEAGVPQGNTNSTVGQCPQVPAPLGPALGGNTGRISRIDASLNRSTFASGLPSAMNQLGDVVGIADLAFVGGTLYGLVGAGCSHGHTDVPSAVLRFTGGGAWTVTADLSTWIAAHPTANPSPGDFEPDGDWYGMVASGNTLFAVEANQGNIVSVNPNSGRVDRVADVSATQGHVVPTAGATTDSYIYVGELTPFPAVPGASKVLRYLKTGQLAGTIPGFTAVLGVQVDRFGNVFVLESFTCPDANPCFPSPGSGRVVRLGAATGRRTVVASGLSFATGLRIGPDGALYISNFGYGPPASGEIVRVTLAP